MSAVAQSASFLGAFDLDYFFPNGGLRRGIDPALLARIMALRANIRENLANLRAAAYSGRDISESAKRLLASIQEQSAKAKALLAKETDPGKRIMLQSAIDELDRLTTYVLAHPNEPNARAQLEEVLDID